MFPIVLVRVSIDVLKHHHSVISGRKIFISQWFKSSGGFLTRWQG